MKPASELFSFQTTFEQATGQLIRSERDELILKFFDKNVIKLFKGKPKTLQQATKAEIALLLKDCPTADLYPFFKQCENARDFGKYFWWSLKGKRSAVDTK